MVTLAHTSVPAWSVAPHIGDVDPSGREVLLVAVGRAAEPAATEWRNRISSSIPLRIRRFDDLGTALAGLRDDTATTRVGARLMLAGTALDCAQLRAQALALGWTDEEIRIGASTSGERAVSCTHCGATTVTHVAMDEVVACAGCGRNLLIYHHFSRRTGLYLGYMVDAEDDPLVEADR